MYLFLLQKYSLMKYIKLIRLLNKKFHYMFKCTLKVLYVIDIYKQKQINLHE